MPPYTWLSKFFFKPLAEKHPPAHRTKMFSKGMFFIHVNDSKNGIQKKNLSISSNNTSFSAPIIWDFVTITYLKAFDKILDRKIMVQEYVDENL